MVKLLTGKEVVAALREDLAARIEHLADAGITPTLAIVRVGERPDDMSYERTAMKRAEGLGIAVRSFALPADAAQADLEAVIDEVNADDALHGCLLFRPLPPSMDERAVCDRLAPEKDIDGISSASLAGVFADTGEGFPPATAQACLEILDFYGIPIEGKRAVVLGRSLVIGRPVACMLLARHATVTLAHSRTADAAAHTREADIVVCATGRARAYGAEFFSPGQTVLDVGINFEDGALCGDVNFDAAIEALGEGGAITPVPGGLGSVTTSVTMAHVVAAAERVLAG
ncbi:tetrahydrofolate dehydrogenase/cyclohydrolase catalytic domain-containing protein [Adlercreutzia sp. R25]|uniref:Bifunctional protein FolD n=1 Tax=Adlercreutzia shanghongiae TaxID=3111773 RepID=A0ABU6IYB6_9ACTN|nr:MULTISPECIES: tetrahydrofolate dehydrogenase/cyclohydrolase catalytic domain-containing protein [unclassified Adlercreutzia]MEC4271766.1 tetrahydrofolate dehydrogenase/cyclohydrolase catalytic domain-containing protein [Adlercreutzia sp. R25]MEC4294773.1 tetrahydrofolate dehydrogenase/cyclohydrolase catalytic domain-containing protein [Adlercreutzia sp. R22]